MSDSNLILVALVALLVGVLIPVLVQVRAAFRVLEQQLRSTGPRLDRVLDDAETTLARLSQISRGLEGGDQKLARLLDATDQLSLAIKRVTDLTRVASAVGAAIGPAVAAAVQVLRDGDPGDGEPADDGSVQEDAMPAETNVESRKEEES